MERHCYLWVFLVSTCVGIVMGIAISAGADQGIIIENVPNPSDYPAMARYIIHNTLWLSIATISTQTTIPGLPFVALKSFADGPESQSTGTPYLYLTDMDYSAQDILANNNVTILATLAELDYCNSLEYDAQDPRCAKVMITGKVIQLENGTVEQQFGYDSLIARHPAMKDWPANHVFYVSKVVPEQILVLDHFGGAGNVSVEDYFNANVTDFIRRRPEITSYVH